MSVSFGALLQQYRTAAGLSQEELAERAGLSRRGISDLERGTHRTPYPATVRRLTEALGLPESERAVLLHAAHGSAPPSPVSRLRLGLHEPLSTFVGRNRELNDVLRLLLTTRLVTLTGAGGIGKSRLALQVARRVQSGTVALVDWPLYPTRYSSLKASPRPSESLSSQGADCSTY